MPEELVHRGPFRPTRRATTDPYPPHSAVVVSTQDKALLDALEKFTKTSSCPLYLKTAYQKAKAQ